MSQQVVSFKYSGVNYDKLQSIRECHKRSQGETGMKKLTILMIMLIMIMVVAGCAGFPTGKQTTSVGSMLLNKVQIDKADVIKEPTVQYQMNALDPTDIAELISMVSEIPVTRLSPQQDIDFMTERMLQEHLTVSMYSHDDYTEKLEGFFLIWPDGIIYATDPESMTGTSRTIAYLSEASHSEIYQWLINTTESDQQFGAQQEISARLVRDQGYTILVNSGASFSLQMPASFDEQINGVDIGALLKAANEQSKLNGLDFSSYLGQEVMLITYAGEKPDGAIHNLDIIMDGSKVIGYWVDEGAEPPDFNAIVNASQPPMYNPKQLMGFLQDYDPQTRVLTFDEIEWVVNTDAVRISQLGLDADLDFPNGYYIYNQSEQKVSMKAAHQVKVYLVNWNDLATPTSTDITGLTRRMAEYPAPYHMKFQDGVIYEIREQYRP